MKNQNTALSRRNFLAGAAVAMGAPYVVPSAVLGANAPSNRITIGCIGVGRMGMGDVGDMIARKESQIIAVCDVDAHRKDNAKRVVESHYARRSDGGTYQGCMAFDDYRQLLARPDIDAVQIVTPDSWHAPLAVAAAKAGKDIFLQKPLTYTLQEGRWLSETVRRYGRIFQCGSQQRSDYYFRFACELARNQYFGKLHTIEVGLPTDPGGPTRAPMPVPAHLNYDMWLGPAPWAEYTEDRVHPADIKQLNGRPGWLRVEEYCLGMITGWGAHHLDIAQWAMGTEYTGPVEIEGKAEYPTDGVWTVHGPYNITYTYANGVKVLCSDKYKTGVRFVGSDGWVFVTRGFMDAQPKSLLKAVLRPDEVHLYRSTHHKQNFLDCIKSRQETIAPAEIAHRSCSVCIVGHIAMKLGRKLKWDPQQERFTNDEAANRMLGRPMREPWNV